MEQQHEHNFLRSESGTLLVFLGMVTVALFGLLALVIDGAVIASSQSQFRNTADFAVLAALKTYASNGDQANEARLAAAVERAAEITGVNVELIAQTGFIESTDGADELGSASEEEGGQLIPGKWHFSESDSSPEHCGTGADFVPCFEEIAPDQTANAFRLVVRLHNERSVRTFFARIMSYNSVDVKAVSTAALLPRVGVFVVDLSRAMTRTTHTSFGKKAEYAFAIKPTVVAPLAPYANQLHGNDQGVFDALDATRPVGDTNTAVHYESDYTQVVDVGNLTGNAQFTNQRFVVDTVTKPEPLTSVLSGVHRVMSAVAGRNVSGDKLGFIGFDKEVLDIRKLNLSEPANAEFQAFVDATDTTIPLNQYEKFLFPRKFDAAANEIISNLRVALEAAYVMIEADQPPDLVERFVMLVTDGLSGCPEAKEGAATPCEESQEYIEEAITEIKSFLKENFKTEEIALHIVLANPKVAPHTLARSAGDGEGCMTDGNVRDADGGEFTSIDDSWAVSPVNWADPAHPIYYPNTLYDEASDLNGLWGPVRPCCRGDNGGGSPEGDCKNVVEDLNNVCATEPEAGKTINSSPGFATFLGGEGNWAKVPGVDDKGRLFCDPAERDEKEQIEDYFNALIKNPPIVLVR